MRKQPAARSPQRVGEGESGLSQAQVLPGGSSKSPPIGLLRLPPPPPPPPPRRSRKAAASGTVAQAVDEADAEGIQPVVALLPDGNWQRQCLLSSLPSSFRARNL